MVAVGKTKSDGDSVTDVSRGFVRLKAEGKKKNYIYIWRVAVSGDKSSEEENMLIRSRKV